MKNITWGKHTQRTTCITTRPTPGCFIPPVLEEAAEVGLKLWPCLLAKAALPWQPWRVLLSQPQNLLNPSTPHLTASLRGGNRKTFISDMRELKQKSGKVFSNNVDGQRPNQHAGLSELNHRRHTLVMMIWGQIKIGLNECPLQGLGCCFGLSSSAKAGTGCRKSLVHLPR